MSRKRIRSYLVLSLGGGLAALGLTFGAGSGCGDSATPSAGLCNTIDDCEKGQFCVEGRCSDICTQDTHCGDGMLCVESVCTEDPSAECNRAGHCVTPGSCEVEDGVRCVRGVCVYPARHCDQTNFGCRSNGSCNPSTGKCEYDNATDLTPCSDGDLCTENDRCLSGECVSDPIANGQPCDGTTGVCQDGACIGCTENVHCADNNDCTEDVCNSGTCNNTPLHLTTCDDGNACTQTDTCNNGSCAGSDPVVCSALSQCHDPGTCDPSTGECSNPVKTGNPPCDDADPCTYDTVCQSDGSCGGGSSHSCDGAVAACDGVCDGAGGCTWPNASTACTDTDPCTYSTTCRTGGACLGTTNPCTPDDNECTGTCNGSGGCTWSSNSCSDSDPCTYNTTCKAGGFCTGTTYNCSGSDRECSGTCNGSGGCNWPSRECGSCGRCSNGSCTGECLGYCCEPGICQGSSQECP